MDTEPILQHFRSLDAVEKIELLGQLWNEVIDDPSSVPLSDDLRDLLDERLAQHEESPDDVHDWADVKAEALRRLTDK